MTETPRGARMRARLVAGCLAVTVPIALGVLAGVPAAGTPTSGDEVGSAGKRLRPPVPLPAHPSGLPAPISQPVEIDPAAGYQPQQACLAKPMPGIVKLRALALQTYDRGGESPATPRACTTSGTSEHKDGRAWDWMLDHSNRQDRSVAADFIAWLVGPGPSGVQGEMADRLGVMYIIYNREIWASYSPGWRTYTGSDPHTTHIHISLSWNGARAHTSFWTGRVWPVDQGTCQVFKRQPAVVPTNKPRTTSCPEPVRAPRTSTMRLQWIGSSGSEVSDAQRILDVTATGSYDRATRRAVLGYQHAHDLPRTGCLDDSTWASLLPESAKLHVPVWTPREAAIWAADNGLPTLHRGAAGKSVYAVQVALRLDPSVRNGFFGSQTRAAVVALKQAAGLPATPTVDAAVWGLLPVPPGGTDGPPSPDRYIPVDPGLQSR